MYAEYDLPEISSGKVVSAHGAGQQGLPVVHWPSQSDKMLQYHYRLIDYGAQAFASFVSLPM